MVTFAIATLLTIVASSAASQDNSSFDEQYPNLDLHILDQREQQLFVELVESQQCPCDQSQATLAQCLTDPAERCRLAELAASRLMRRIKEEHEPDSITSELRDWITAALTPVQFNLELAPRQGPSEATVQIVVFSDFECPYCRLFAEIIESLREEYSDHVAVYFKHLPIESHPNAAILARATVAAQNQDQFWPMHDLLFAQQQRLRYSSDITEAILQLANTLPLDMERFAADLLDPVYDTIPSRDRDEARIVGVRATPSCFINGFEFHEIGDVEGLRARISRLIDAQ